MNNQEALNNICYTLNQLGAPNAFERADDYIIPKGWWEYRHYNPEESYNGVIDDEILAWRYIEPFEEVE